jgi:hypothetical protein
MITIIFGPPGVGKTKLLAHLASERMTVHAFQDMLACKRKVENLRACGFTALSLPQKHVVFADLPLCSEARIMPVRRCYYVDGFRLGLCNDEAQTAFLPPYAQVYLSEAQRYFNARAYKKFPDYVSRFFETHRHYGLNITLDCQRPGLIDLNIRGIAGEFIRVLNSCDKTDREGRVVSSTWDCLVFFDNSAAEKYVETGEAVGAEKRRYEHKGNIYACYDSYCYQRLHLQGRECCDFDLLSFPAV